MELKTKFKKLASGKIECIISVEDRRDYPTDLIFSHFRAYPSSEDYTLEPRGWSHIEYIASNSEEALEWVSKEVEALRSHLQKWRDIKVPEETTYII